MADVIFSNAEINRIGLNILGDYAYMLVQAIISDDPDRIRQARGFAARFDSLYNTAVQNLTPQARTQLNKDSIDLSQEFRRFVLDLLRVVLTKEFDVFFKPATLNNMVGFAEYHMDLINTFLLGRQPQYDPVQTELFWLPVLETQCRYITDNIGYYERALRARAIEFAELFDAKYIFTVELQGLSRIGTNDFPIAQAHHREIVSLLNRYAQLLVEIILVRNQNQVPGTLSLLYLDSGYRQLCIFTTELSTFTGTAKPACNPFARRYTIL